MNILEFVFDDGQVVHTKLKDLKHGKNLMNELFRVRNGDMARVALLSNGILKSLIVYGKGNRR